MVGPTLLLRQGDRPARGSGIGTETNVCIYPSGYTHPKGKVIHNLYSPLSIGVLLPTSISGYAPIGQIISQHQDREEVFSPLRGGKYPPAEGGKRSPYSRAPQAPQEATYIGSEIPAIFSPKQQAIPQHHSHHLHRSKKRPLLVSKQTSTTHPIVPVLLTRVTSTGSVYRYMGTWAELYRMAKKAI